MSINYEALKREYLDPNTTPARKVEICAVAQDLAERYDSQKCIQCKTRMFYAQDTEARIPGHIYSAAGLKEAGITYLCEFCFDQITAEPEDEEECYFGGHFDNEGDWFQCNNECFTFEPPLTPEEEEMVPVDTMV